jgi:hypothetical protein
MPGGQTEITAIGATDHLDQWDTRIRIDDDVAIRDHIQDWSGDALQIHHFLSDPEMSAGEVFSEQLNGQLAEQCARNWHFAIEPAAKRWTGPGLTVALAELLQSVTRLFTS